MPSAEQVVGRLKEAGFRFDHETEHVKVFKGTVDGKMKRIQVMRRRILDEITSRSVLRQAGLSHEQVNEFHRACNA